LKKGVVRSARVHRLVCEEIAALVQSLGWQVAGTMPSPIRGGDGNREFFIGARID
jgi:23S rRNA (cytidine1920-2'-O)/16S rRNA (cytidine1409-2'-O)-methyltransferase